MVKILVTRQIPDRFVEQLEQFGDVKVWEKAFEPMPREQFLKELEDVDACFITLSEKIDATCLEHAKHVKVIANMAVGFDNIDVKLAQEKGIVVTNTPRVLTETTAELGFTLMLTVARRIVEAEKYVQDGEWKSWGPYLLSGKDVHGSTVGIYGMGDIGKSFARRLQGFNTTILYHNRSRHEDAETELNASYVSFDTLLADSDFVVCTAPLTPETENKFNKDAFSKMKNDAIFINIGRGAIVDEDALIDALDNHEIGGCGLDVLREEPIKLDHPLLKMENAVILPHIGSASVATRDRMIQLCVDNIAAILKGAKPLTPITNK
ncbi:D-glycerate dehydrogenase [Staphylococcus haemolyticus]|uniref:D-glycerate dehydrogenase n=1 Tax=Staphylococcus haemolyticus TaxID=1283 RepID=A0AB38PD73_STAHA|nr:MULTISPECIES: D-glycerate dehydrogenase [Staphylococcus]MCE4962934.1 D-glycerate dehydrogenase [Staphylococcus haemolyticus]MCE4987079.1 D-glycerate dehydrogenase [Staphylococcus haemolyticus]MCE5035415.1 D-glycerate dehydrogenase [Staphylococcus haemolyticus]MWF62792.1 D-glycerate dehydrogenase [Staphylococcus haemolyticus]PTK41633.1 D-glycerate dehydrogenase [Staphylococcus haemolyticus]